MVFNPGLQYDEYISNPQLREIFKCSPQGGMRRSYKTNTLVLISDRTKKQPYQDHWSDDNRTFFYTGMGLQGNQNLYYSQNRTLLESNLNRVEVFLFEFYGTNNYKYIGQVLLAGEPFKARQLDRNNMERDVWMFPLIRIGSAKNIIDFLIETSFDVLQKHNVLDCKVRQLNSHSVIPLSQLMRSQDIQTLVGPGGWFFTYDLHFYNNALPPTSIEISGKTHQVTSQTAHLVFLNQNKFLNPFLPNSLVYDVGNKKTDLNSEISVRSNPKFRLLNLKYQDLRHPLFEIQFLEDTTKNDESRSPFTTLLIGPNGTGKSTVLAILQKIFLCLFDISSSKQPEYFPEQAVFSLTYLVDDQEVEINGSKQDFSFKVGNEPTPLNKVPLPQRLLASAALLNDKFTFAKSDMEYNNEYVYAGVRTDHNVAQVETPFKKLISILIESSVKDGFLENLRFMTQFLGLKPTIRLVFNSGLFPLNRIKNGNINRWKQVLEDAELDSFEALESSLQGDILDFLGRIAQNNPIMTTQGQGRLLIFDLDLQKHKIYDDYVIDIQIMIEMLKSGVLTYKSIQVMKVDSFFDFELASAGEFHFFTTMVTLLSSVRENSLVLVDEPEVSLHPNWQYKYIDGLKQIFHQYPSCHFVMATHSHFMVADLEPDSSSIVSLGQPTVKSGEIIATLHDEKTYGWSAEDILYVIFRMKTSRNYYLQQDLHELLSLISHNSVDFSRIGELVSKVEKLHLNEKDPLNLVILQAKEYLLNR